MLHITPTEDIKIEYQAGRFTLPECIVMRYGMLGNKTSNSSPTSTLTRQASVTKSTTITIPSQFEHNTPPRSLLPCRFGKDEGRGLFYHTLMDCDYLSVAEKRELIDDSDKEPSSDDESHIIQ